MGFGFGNGASRCGDMLAHLYGLVLVTEPRALEIGVCIFMGFGFGQTIE